MASMAARTVLESALPFIPSHGFTYSALLAASSSHQLRTLKALFPPTPSPARKSTSSRQELIRSAQSVKAGSAAVAEAEEVCPELVELWLKAKREQVKGKMRDNAGPANESNKARRIKEALLDRLRLNAEVEAHLPAALKALGAPRLQLPFIRSPSIDNPGRGRPTVSDSLTSLFVAGPGGGLLPRSPPTTRYLKEVGQLVESVLRESGDRSMSLDWYDIRARLGTIYVLAEQPHILGGTSSDLSTRTEASGREFNEAWNQVESWDATRKRAVGFGHWVVGSWKGILRSQGPL